MQINDDRLGSQSFLFTNLIHILRKLSSLGKEKTVLPQHNLIDNQQHNIYTPQHIFYYYFPRFASTSLLFTHTRAHTHTHTHTHTRTHAHTHTRTHAHTHTHKHQSNSYMKTHKHENIRMFEKHAPGVLLLAL